MFSLQSRGGFVQPLRGCTKEKEVGCGWIFSMSGWQESQQLGRQQYSAMDTESTRD